MVDEYLSDHEQEEALRQWWRENWLWIVSGVVLGVGMLGGWRYWDTHREHRAVSASLLYTQFQGALQQRDVDQAARLLQDLTAAHASSAYTQQGRLLLAKAEVEADRFDEAIALLRLAADDSKDTQLAQVARLRAARLLVQQERYDEVLQLLDMSKAGAFAAQAREIRGDAMTAKGDLEAARAEYAAALAAADGAVDRGMLVLKLQEVGGGADAALAQEQPR